jgi:hypothetical protein
MNSSVSEQEKPRIAFSVARGGPYYELQRRMGLLTDDNLHVGRRALVFTGLAWAMPLLLSAIIAAGGDWTQILSYLGDSGTWAKFLIAIAAFVLAEKFVDKGLQDKLAQFTHGPIIAPKSFSDASRATKILISRRDSGFAELICLLLSCCLSVLTFSNLHAAKLSSWAVQVGTEGNRITLAGWWVLLVSLPLFGFLFWRGVWRHYLWSWLLRRFAKLDLRLVATHPDKSGGLAFLSSYPASYILFVFGASVALSGAMLKNQHLSELTSTTFTIIMVGWLVIVLAFFAFPLMAFARPLAELKRDTLLQAAAQATRFWRQSERKTLGKNTVADDEGEEIGDPPPEIPDPAKYFDAAAKLSAMLLDHKAAIPIALAALLPVAAVGAANLPFKEVVEVLKKLIVL